MNSLHKGNTQISNKFDLFIFVEYEHIHVRWCLAAFRPFLAVSACTIFFFTSSLHVFKSILYAPSTGCLTSPHRSILAVNKLLMELTHQASSVRSEFDWLWRRFTRKDNTAKVTFSLFCHVCVCKLLIGLSVPIPKGIMVSADTYEGCSKSSWSDHEEAEIDHSIKWVSIKQNKIRRSVYTIINDSLMMTLTRTCAA